MKTKIIILTAMLATWMGAWAQSASEIKNSKEYLSGEGTGETLKAADNAALNDLLSKISVNVQGSFSTVENEVVSNGKVDASAATKMVVNTYSQATLTNTNRIVVSNEPDAHVVRYVKRSEIERIFAGRKNKVLDLVGLAYKAEKAAKIDDALRNYYWALCMLKSLQYENEVKWTDNEGAEHILSSWIPQQINSILGGVSVAKAGLDGNDLLLYFTYGGKPVQSLDFTYFDGVDWSSICSVRDGRGMAEMRPGQVPDNLSIKCEYAYEGQSHIDKEIETVMGVMKGTSFRKAYLQLNTGAGAAQASSATAAGAAGSGSPSTFAAAVASLGASSSALSNPAAFKASGLKAVDNVGEYDKIMGKITDAIKSRNYASVQSLFTTAGWTTFKQLIDYGTARLYGTPKYTYVGYGDKVICRGLPMNFSFKANRRRFMEEVTFMFNANRKIDNVAFGLGEQAEQDILMKGDWSDLARVALMNFLEDYKTAFALKDINYLESVFDDNAVIVVGKELRRLKNQDTGVQLNEKTYKYATYTKEQYLKNLRYSFRSQEFINIRFANNDVIKLGKGGEIYGIQIKQDYYSSSYGDTGYLFLMVDLNDPEKPIIKVRTWQPERDPNFGKTGLIGPYNF
ncbi:MAG: LPP20 family lipoprotein [Muribaculaceae bacterium]